MFVGDFMHQKQNEPKTNLDGSNSEGNHEQSSCHIFHVASHIAVSLPGLLFDPALEVSKKGISFSQKKFLIPQILWQMLSCHYRPLRLSFP